MSTLIKLQQDFQKALLSPPGKKALLDTTFGHLEVYIEGYRIRLRDCLMEDFPKLHTLLGDDGFEKMATIYITHYPSHYFSIRYFGQHLGTFLSEDATYCKKPYLAEMAHFEWLLRGTLDAQDAPLLNLEALQMIPADHWPDLYFSFHPSVQILTCHYDTPALWLAIDKEEEPRSPRLEAQPRVWRLWRKDRSTWFHSCSLEETFLLEGIQQHRSFAILCEGLCDYIPEESVPQTAINFLSLLIFEGLIQALH